MNKDFSWPRRYSNDNRLDICTPSTDVVLYFDISRRYLLCYCAEENAMDREQAVNLIGEKIEKPRVRLSITHVVHSARSQSTASKGKADQGYTLREETGNDGQHLGIGNGAKEDIGNSKHGR